MDSSGQQDCRSRVARAGPTILESSLSLWCLLSAILCLAAC